MISMDGTSFLNKNDDIKGTPDFVLVEAKEFSTVSSNPIPVGRWSDLFFNDDAQSMDGIFFLQRIEGKTFRRKSPP